MSTETPRRSRPKPFAEDWSLDRSAQPPTTVANPLGALAQQERAAFAAGQGRVDVWGGIDLSPDGSEVAFSWDRSGAREIYTAPLVGERLIQLTGGASKSVAPRWSPDGAWIAFLRDTDGKGASQIWLVDRDGAHERPLSDDPATHLDLAWSPDGTRLAYSADPHGKRALYAVDVASGQHRRLTDGVEARAPRWSPDGQWALFEAGTDLFLVPSAGGEAKLLYTRNGTTGTSSQGVWSPDGSAIAFTTNVRGRREIAFAYLSDGAVSRVERLGATPFEDSDPTWRPDGRAVLYLHAQDANVSVRRVFTISHADEAVMDLPGAYSSPRVAPDGDTTVAVFTPPDGPAVLVVRPKGSPQIRRIT